MGGSGARNKKLSVCEKYSEENDKWTQTASLSESKNVLSACVVGINIYAIGGRLSYS